MNTNEDRARERQAFHAGAEWRQWNYGKHPDAEAARRYPHLDIQLAPSGKHYRLVETEWGLELKSWDSEGAAIAGQCPHFVGVRRGDERVVAELLQRFADDA